MLNRLAAHTSVTVVSRDRSGLYAEAARTGAQTATQVADRRHLLVYVYEALRGIIERHQSEIRDVAHRAVPPFYATLINRLRPLPPHRNGNPIQAGYVSLPVRVLRLSRPERHVPTISLEPLALKTKILEGLEPCPFKLAHRHRIRWR